MKGYEYQSDFAKKYVALGAKAAGEAPRGRRAPCWPRSGFAASPCRTPPASASWPRRIRRVERWLERAIVAASVAEVLDEPS